MFSCLLPPRRSRLFRVSSLCLLVAAAFTLHLSPPLHGSGPARIAPAQVATDIFVSVQDDGSSTTFWLTDAGHASKRQRLRTVEHARGWSGAATVAPDGRGIAYTRLPQNESNPDRQAELWFLRIADRRATMLAAGVDLRSILVWPADSSAVIYQRFDGGQAQLWRQALAGGPGEFVAASAPGTALIPIGYTGPQRDLLAARFDRQGTDLIGVHEAGSAEVTWHLADGPARNLVLSPDGTRLAFLFVDMAGPSLSRAGTVDLATGDSKQLPVEWGEAVGVAWEPDGTLMAGSAGPAAGLRLESGAVLRPAGPAGFAQPLAWSPSGRFLAARRFSGRSGQNPGSARDVILDREGADSGGGVAGRFAGWLAPAGSGGAG